MAPNESESTETFEHVVEMPRRNGEVLIVRLSIASVPKIGPGPRPGKGELRLAVALEEDEILTIESLMPFEAAAPAIGAGQGPR